LQTSDPHALNAPAARACNVVELRQYLLHPHQRDVLIELFDREFVETQEAAGMRVMGQFRDLDDPDRFVWLRGFGDMAARHRALEAFYGGPAWAAHRDVANGTMVDSDNVLLLRPAWPGAGIDWPQGLRAAPGAQDIPAGLIQAAILHLNQPAAADLRALCRDGMARAGCRRSDRAGLVRHGAEPEHVYPAAGTGGGKRPGWLRVVLRRERVGGLARRRPMDPRLGAVAMAGKTA
jgi:NIPSNAP